MNVSRQAVLLHSPEIEQFQYPDFIPLKTQRAKLLRRAVYSMGLLCGPDAREVAPRKATREELELYHAPHYLDAIQRAERGDVPAGSLRMGLGSPDCPVFAGMYDYSALACGATLAGARLIIGGEADVAFNPSGGYHHAHRDRAGGFCYMNDVVLGALVLSAAGRRVLFLDLDVHHCDGVQAAFWTRRDVMTISLHESGKTLFPGTGNEDEIGECDGRGCSVNVPLPVGTYDAAYMKAYRDVALPLIEAYAPDVLMLELGMDTLAGDPLAHLQLTNSVIADIVASLRDLNKPILAVGGGGYNVDATVRGWALMWSVLCGEQDCDASTGMGDLMLENTGWVGGLRDGAPVSEAGKRESVDADLDATIRRVRKLVFPLHGLEP
jgi:acetoin utilization protein AcuC